MEGANLEHTLKEQDYIKQTYVGGDRTCLLTYIPTCSVAETALG